MFISPRTPSSSLACPTAVDRSDRTGSASVWDALRADLDVNPKLEFRALRNWHVSTLDASGFDLAKIGRRVGHSQLNSATAMTSHYSLSEQKADAEMAQAIEVRLDEIEAGQSRPESSKGELHK